MQLAIIGIGAPFSDDTLGWQLLDALAQRGLDLPGWRPFFDKADRPGPGLLERLRDCDAAVLLDAMHAGGEAGTVRQVERPELATANRLSSGHALGVAEALALGERLGLLPPRLYIIGIEMGGGLPAASVDRAAELIEELFDKRH